MKQAYWMEVPVRRFLLTGTAHYKILRTAMTKTRNTARPMISMVIPFKKQHFEKVIHTQVIHNHHNR